MIRDQGIIRIFWLLLSVIGCVSAPVRGQPSSTAGTRNGEWIGAACEYATAFRENQDNQETFNKSIERLSRARTALEAAPVPDVETIVALLDSSAAFDRECALAAVAVKGVIGGIVVSRILHNYPNENLFRRYLSGSALGRMSSKEAEASSGMLFRVLSAERSAAPIAASAGALLRMSRQSALDLFVALMAKGDFELRITVYDIASKRGDGVAKDLVVALGRQNAVEALNAIENYERVHKSIPAPPGANGDSDPQHLGNVGH